jgi:hypothetical protein
VGVILGIPSYAQLDLKKTIYAIHRTSLAASVNPDVVTHVAICEALVVLVGAFNVVFGTVFLIISNEDMFLSLFELVTIYDG